MNTLPDDLLGLVAKIDPDAFQSMFINQVFASRFIDEYMKNAHQRIMDAVHKHIHPDILRVIIDNNYTISGSFILQALCGLDFGYRDLDLISTQDLPQDIIEKLILDEKYIAHCYDNVEIIRYIYTNKHHQLYNRNPEHRVNELDFIILESDHCVSDLLDNYDFDFVKNSLEFLADGNTRLTIMCPSSLFARRCYVDLDCYGITKTDNAHSIDMRFRRLLSRVDKYRCRGFYINCDTKKLDFIIKYLEKYKLKNRVNLKEKYYNSVYSMFDDSPLLKPQRFIIQPVGHQ